MWWQRKTGLGGEGHRGDQGGVEVDAGRGRQISQPPGHRPSGIPLVNGQLDLSEVGGGGDRVGVVSDLRVLNDLAQQSVG